MFLSAVFVRGVDSVEAYSSSNCSPDIHVWAQVKISTAK